MVNSTGINSAQSNFLEYDPSLRKITRSQVPSRVRAWFHDSAGDIDFYQLSLSQSESTISHEIIVLTFTHLMYFENYLIAFNSF